MRLFWKMVYTHRLVAAPLQPWRRETACLPRRCRTDNGKSLDISSENLGRQSAHTSFLQLVAIGATLVRLSGEVSASIDSISQWQYEQEAPSVCWSRLRVLSLGLIELAPSRKDVVPQLQNSRRRSKLSRTPVASPSSFPRYKILSRAWWHCCSRMLYCFLSSRLNIGRHSSNSIPGSESNEFGRRIHIEDNNVRRLSKFEPTSYPATLITPIICLRNLIGSSRIGSRMNRTRAPISSREFWIGMPVIHHRLRADRWWIAWNCLVDQFLIAWAVRSLLENHSIYIDSPGWCSLHRALCGTSVYGPGARGFEPDQQPRFRK